jgi:hypothetical protein
MNKILKAAFAAAALFTASFALACDYPERPHIPDGAAASKDQLLEAKAGVQTFIAAVDEYLTCLEDQEKAAVAELENPAPEELQGRNDMLNKKFDAANEEKALVGEQFNQQIRAYNQKLKESKE